MRNVFQVGKAIVKTLGVLTGDPRLHDCFVESTAEVKGGALSQSVIFSINHLIAALSDEGGS